MDPYEIVTIMLGIGMGLTAIAAGLLVLTIVIGFIKYTKDMLWPRRK